MYHTQSWLEYRKREMERKRREMSSSICLSRLSPSWGEMWIKDTFSKFGRIINIDIPIHRNGARKGIAFIQYSTNDEAAAAISAMSIFIF